MTIEAKTFWLDYFTVTTISINIRILFLYTFSCYLLHFISNKIPTYKRFSGIHNMLFPNERETGFRKYTKSVK